MGQGHVRVELIFPGVYTEAKAESNLSEKPDEPLTRGAVRGTERTSAAGAGGRADDNIRTGWYGTDWAVWAAGKVHPPAGERPCPWLRRPVPTCTVTP